LAELSEPIVPKVCERLADTFRQHGIVRCRADESLAVDSGELPYGIRSQPFRATAQVREIRVANTRKRQEAAACATKVNV